ncbi:MAG: hypothetical protein MUP85_06770 [Candidatus Lokiarchaeota archaeon]|nr:hypothetical protein [Candidatus Lokiarchaeota archaeon]
MEPVQSFRQMLNNKGYSEEAIEKLWKCMTFQRKKEWQVTRVITKWEYGIVFHYASFIEGF